MLIFSSSVEANVSFPWGNLFRLLARLGIAPLILFILPFSELRNINRRILDAFHWHIKGFSGEIADYRVSAIRRHCPLEGSKRRKSPPLDRPPDSKYPRGKTWIGSLGES